MKVHKTIKKMRKATEKGDLSRVKVGTSANEKEKHFDFTVDQSDRKALAFLQALFEGEADRQIRRVNDFGGVVHIDVDETHEVITVQTRIGGPKKAFNAPIVFGAQETDVSLA